jgi:hypothetical protein
VQLIPVLRKLCEFRAELAIGAEQQHARAAQGITSAAAAGASLASSRIACKYTP